VHAVEAVDFLDRFLRPERPVGRDYETPGVVADEPEPFVTHVLDSSAKSHFGGRFWIPTGAKELRGMAVRVSRVGQPGPLEMWFGSAPGKDDLGTVKLPPESVGMDKEAWSELRIDARRVEAGMLVYFDVRCAAGTSPENRYVVYGPRPIGGKDWPNRFGLSYRVLTDRPQDALP